MADADTTYAELDTDISGLIGCIQMELETDAGKEEKDWGDVGNLTHVRGELKNILTFLMSFNDEEEADRFIEEHLKERRSRKEVPTRIKN